MTGGLVNSNLLMYDRQTDSRLPQIFGHAIQGPLRGGRLEAVPLTWTTWARWRARHPETEVLSTDTGFVRNYQGDPYGFYDPLRGYYADSLVRFRVACRDNRFHPTRSFVGLAEGNDAVAVDLEWLRANRTQCHDCRTARGLPSRRGPECAPRVLRDGRHRPAPPHLGRLLPDAETNSRWSPDGVAIAGPLEGSRLAELPAMHVMCFAWAAFYPWTRVHAG